MIGMYKSWFDKVAVYVGLNLDEAFSIQKTYFPDIPIRVLFKEDACKELDKVQG